MTRLRTSLAYVALSLSMAACAGPAEEDKKTGPVGKGDSLASCEGASLDSQQVCRLGNGTFASESCCDLEFGEDGTFDDGSGVGCIFGDHLVMMARMADLDVSEPQVIDDESIVDGIILQQLLDTGFDTVTNLEDLLDQTDDRSIDLITVRDEAHRRNFNMYIWSSGDTIVGQIYYSQSMRKAAEIGDGGISSCDAGYSNFDDLPFFYVN